MIKQKGFTLIELLIVIVILGILAGVVLSVINPGRQQTKAKNAVLRSSVEKMCITLHACSNSTLNATRCDTFAKMGLTVPAAPVGAGYTVTPSPALSGDTLTVRGTLGTCVITCTARPSTGLVTSMTVGAACGF